MPTQFLAFQKKNQTLTKKEKHGKSLEKYYAFENCIDLLNHKYINICIYVYTWRTEMRDV